MIDANIIKLEPPLKKQVPVAELIKELCDTAVQLCHRRKFKAALAMTLRAVALEPNCAAIWANVGNYLWNLQRFDEAKIAIERSLKIEPDHPVATCTMGLILASLGRFEETEPYFNKAIASDTNEKNVLNARWDRALFYLSSGDYIKGFRDYETRIDRDSANGYRERKPPMPIWQGESLVGKRIFVNSEQGIGDNIIYSRFIPWLCLQGAERVLWCLPNHLISLFWEFRNTPSLEFIPEGIPISTLNADYYLFAGSLPLRYGLTLENIPPDPGLILKRVNEHPKVARITLPEPNGSYVFKIGIAWTGNPAMDRNEERTVPLEFMLELVTIPNVWLHSFQVGFAAKHIEELGAEQMICDLSPQLEFRGLAACGAALQEMDLVITSCTSIAHLAGALGVPCWVMLAYDAFWLWLRERSDSPWYPSIRLFRQPRSKDWVSVAKEVRTALVERLDNLGVASPVRKDRSMTASNS
jgi:tetratricopeptide (TPR) repeat protein